MPANTHELPTEYPVKDVKVTMGMTLDSVDQAEYLDLYRQGLIVEDEQPTTQPAAATRRAEQE